MIELPLDVELGVLESGSAFRPKDIDFKVVKDKAYLSVDDKFVQA